MANIEKDLTYEELFKYYYDIMTDLEHDLFPALSKDKAELEINNHIAQLTSEFKNKGNIKRGIVVIMAMFKTMGEQEANG